MCQKTSSGKLRALSICSKNITTQLLSLLKKYFFLNILKINNFLLSELCHSRKQFAAVDLQTQAFYAIVDQTLHGSHPFGKPVAQIIDDLCKTYSPATVAPGMSISMHFCEFLLSVDINPSIRNSSIRQIPVQCQVYCISLNRERQPIKTSATCSLVGVFCRSG